jgi:hypothetical protein
VYAVSLKVKSAVKSQNPPKLGVSGGSKFTQGNIYTIVGMSDERNAFNKSLSRLWGDGDTIYKTEAPIVLQHVSKAAISHGLEIEKLTISCNQLETQ